MAHFEEGGFKDELTYRGYWRMLSPGPCPPAGVTVPSAAPRHQSGDVGRDAFPRSRTISQDDVPPASSVWHAKSNNPHRKETGGTGGGCKGHGGTHLEFGDDILN